MRLSIIVAVSADGAIGKENKLPWHLPADLKRFKKITINKTVIMGRNTFNSLPNGALPNRRNIVISSIMEAAPSAEVYHSLGEALEILAHEEEVFVIGGAKLYKSTLPIADRIYFTRVNDTFPGADTFFPDIDFTEWKAVYHEHFSADDQNPYETVLTIYDRVQIFKEDLLTKRPWEINWES